MIKVLLSLLFSINCFASLNDVDKAFFVNKNIIPNPGFENGKAKWTNSGGGTLSLISGVGALTGTRSGTFDSSASGDYITTSAITIPTGLYGVNGLAQCRFLGVDTSSTHKIQVYDGTNILAEDTITLGTNPLTTSINFIFPDSGSIYLRVYANADESLVTIDDCYLGDASNISDISQAEFVGGLENAGASTCSYGESTSTSTTDFVDLGTGSSCASWTATGAVTAQGTNDHRLVYSNMSPGNYVFILTGYFEGTAAGRCNFRLSDGTNTYQVQGGGGAGAFAFTQLTYSVQVTSPGSRTYKLQAADGGVFTCRWANTSDQPASWKVYRYPLASQTAMKFDTAAWKLDLNISGANVDLGTSDQASYVAPNNGSLTMTVNTSKGSASAGISCSSTNDNTVGSTTCSSGSEELGFVANFPRAGLVEVCYEGSWYVATSTSGTAQVSLQVVRTANGSQTISEEGDSRKSMAVLNQNTSVLQTLNTCGTFQIPSAAKHTIRLMYEQDITATVSSNLLVSDGDVTNGQRDFHITARYIDQTFPMPKIKQSVVTSSDSVWAHESALVTDGTATTTVTRESGDWINGVCTNASTGIYVCTINSGIFSDAPNCVVTIDKNNVNNFCRIESVSSTSVDVRCATITTSPALVDTNFSIHCHGPR